MTRRPNSGPAVPQCTLLQSVPFSIPNSGAFTEVPFDAAPLQVGDIFADVANNRIQVNQPGIYQISYLARWGALPTVDNGTRGAELTYGSRVNAAAPVTANRLYDGIEYRTASGVAVEFVDAGHLFTAGGSNVEAGAIDLDFSILTVRLVGGA